MPVVQFSRMEVKDMKKQLVLIGICVVFFCIELSGCTNGGITNLEYLAANPQEYLEETITIEGMCMSYVNYGWIDDNGHMFYFTYPSIINE